LKKHILSAVKFLVFLGLGAFLVWFAIKGLTEEDKIQIARSLSEANYAWVMLSILVGIIAHWSRAVRWKMLFAPLGLKPKLSNTFYAVMVGYLGNLALPRLGEVLRCGILKRYEKIPLTQSFGTVIVERMIDMLVLLLLFMICAWIEYERLNTYIKEKIIAPLQLKLHAVAENTIMLSIYVCLGLALILTVYLFRKKIFQNPIARKIRAMFISFLEGIRSVTKVKKPLLFIFHSVFIWIMYLMSVYVCVFALKETQSLSLADCLVIMCFGSLGVVATPGGIGAYQWIVLQIMLLWGYSTAIGVAFGWIVWLAQLVLVLVFGLLSLVLLAIYNKEEKII